MRRFLLLLTTVAVAGLVWQPLALSHCEIPCGVYGDRTRIDLLYEHLQTVEKSMQQILALAGKTDAQSLNQAARWVHNKEQHATEIQHVVAQYFMTQRVKPTDSSDADAEAKYHRQLAALHGLLVSAMKCKQSVEVTHVAKSRELLDAFCAAYFSKEDLEHIREHHAGGK
ncbi:MAG: superoxide dismutase [Ni] [Planctomycetota bacterium]